MFRLPVENAADTLLLSECEGAIEQIARSPRSRPPTRRTSGNRSRAFNRIKGRRRFLPIGPEHVSGTAAVSFKRVKRRRANSIGRCNGSAPESENNPEYDWGPSLGQSITPVSWDSFTLNNCIIKYISIEQIHKWQWILKKIKNV